MKCCSLYLNVKESNQSKKAYRNIRESLRYMFLPKRWHCFRTKPVHLDSYFLLCKLRGILHCRWYRNVYASMLLKMVNSFPFFIAVMKISSTYGFRYCVFFRKEIFNLLLWLYWNIDPRIPFQCHPFIV